MFHVIDRLDDLIDFSPCIDPQRWGNMTNGCLISNQSSVQVSWCHGCRTQLLLLIAEASLGARLLLISLIGVSFYKSQAVLAARCVTSFTFSESDSDSHHVFILSFPPLFFKSAYFFSVAEHLSGGKKCRNPHKNMWTSVWMSNHRFYRITLTRWLLVKCSC